MNNNYEMEKKYTIVQDNEFYIDPYIIPRMIINESKLDMSYEKMEEIIKQASITVTDKQIKKYLTDKLQEERPDLKDKIKGEITIKNDIITFTDNPIENEQNIQKNIQQTIKINEVYRYYFEPRSLEYFKKYTEILKIKCQTLLEIINDLKKIKNYNIENEKWQRFVDLDFKINHKGNIHLSDAIRLTETFIYNFKDLYNKIREGNNLETYLTFKKPKGQGKYVTKIYPKTEVQIKDLRYIYDKQFIRLSTNQELELRKNLRPDWLEDEVKENEHSTVYLIKKMSK